MVNHNEKDFFLDSYHYHLDTDLIAQKPTEPRHEAKLLIVESNKKDISASRDSKIWDLQYEISSKDLIVVNNTRVIKARLKVLTSSFVAVELLVLEQHKDAKWLCLARPARKLRLGNTVKLLDSDGNHSSIEFRIAGIDNESGGRIIQFPDHCKDAKSMESFLSLYGEVPLPPYIKEKDLTNGLRYQTRFASSPGAVAAPTAGLHLSDQLLRALREKGVLKACITLHVGLGTFRPIDINDLSQLKLHSEWIEVKNEVVQAISECRARGGKVIAVGTTTVRALEGAFIQGGGMLKPYQGKIDLVIKPGYQFGVVDGLLTNFHLPKSSLLLLVSAFIGRKRLLAIYKKAMKNRYRFFSYGDAMLIPPESVNSSARP